MNQRMPFYMIYEQERDQGIGNGDDIRRRREDVWNEEWAMRRDYDYMRSAYPAVAKRIMPHIEEECDRLEYSGSMMFDEYPDQLQLRLLCRRIFDKVKEKEQEKEKMPDRWLMDLIQVMTYHEIMKRRIEYRKYRRKIF